MAVIFNRSGANFGGAISADAARITFASAGLDGFGVGMLVQSMNMSYQQQVTRVYEIGTDTTYYIAGRTQGQAAMGRIMGPRAVQLGFYTKFGDVCNAATNNINFSATTGCNGTATNLGGTAYAFTLKYVVLTNLGFQIGAQDMVINEQVSMMFASLTAGQNS